MQDIYNYPQIFLDYRNKKNIEILSNIDGIGETQINSIKNFFSNKTNKDVLFQLSKKLLIKKVASKSEDGPLKNKTFMLTGKLKGISRAEAKSLIENNSGKIINNVNKKLNYLITGEKPTIKKVKLAKDLKVTIINQAEWFKMLDKTS